MNLEPISLNKTLEQKLEEELLVFELVEKLINSSSFFGEDLEQLNSISTLLNKNITLLKEQVENFGDEAYFDDRQPEYSDIDLLSIKKFLETLMQKENITISSKDYGFVKVCFNNEQLSSYIESNIESLTNNPNELKSIISKSDDQDELIEIINQRFPELISK